jgi:hypothetical protein
LAKILRGVIKSNLNKKAVLTKKNKKKDSREHSTAANPPPKAHAQKAQRRRVFGSANVGCKQKKETRSSIKQKELNLNKIIHTKYHIFND